MILAQQTIAVLKEWKQEYDRWKELNGDRWQNSPYVFVKEDGGAMHPDSVTDWLGRFSKANTLPHIHPHAFRHTFATMAISNGVDVKMLSSISNQLLYLSTWFRMNTTIRL